MNIPAILTQFFQDWFGDGYSVSPFRSGVQEDAPSIEVLRVIQSTDDIIVEMLKNKKIRTILRTSQSDYIGIRDTDGASFTWSLDFAAPVDYDIDEDIEKIRKRYTEEIVPVIVNDTTAYEMLLTFTLPAKFNASTISGTDYQQVVWGGRGTIVENSVLSNGYSFYIDNARIPGVLSLSNGYTPQGENYTTERREHQRTAVQTFTNAVGLSIHATKDNPVIDRMVKASMLGYTNGFAFEIQQYGVAVATWDAAIFNELRVEGSLGSFVMIEAQILRS